MYEADILAALVRDQALDFKKDKGKYLSGGKCPSCGERELFISKDQPYLLRCNRENNCSFSQSTRERYPQIFEALSERFPATPNNPNAAADAYMSKVRGFPLDAVKGLYTQGQIKIANGSMAEVVLFKLANGHWARIIDDKKVKENDNDKAKVLPGTEFKGLGWIMPNVSIVDGGEVWGVEGILDAIALTLSKVPAFASISAYNFFWALVEANKGRDITWVVALDNDNAGRKRALQYIKELRAMGEKAKAAQPEPGEDWNDAYKAGKLDNKYLKKSLYRGELLTAESKEKRAFLLFTERKQGFYIVEYGTKLYSVKVDIAKYNKDLGDANIDFDDFSEEDDEVKAIYFDHFKKHSVITQICNCVPELKYVQIDKVTKEQEYFFAVAFPNKNLSCIAPFKPSSLAKAAPFNTALLENTPGGNFEGTDKVFTLLKKPWLENIKMVKSLSFIGYDEETEIYCFPTFAYRNGQRYKLNSESYFEVGNDYIKTTLQSLEFVEPKHHFNGDWINDFIDVYYLNGLAALGWWTGSLFTDQIKRRQTSWLFLELTGEPGAGKSSLLRFLWRLYGRPNQEGIKPGEGASKVGLRRQMSQVSNMPVVLIEADIEKSNGAGKKIVIQYPWDEFKELYDYKGVLRSTGVKNNKNDTSELVFNGSLCISQNTSIEASEAILTRIVHLHATKERHTPNRRPKAVRLSNLDTSYLASYLEHALQHEKKWLDAYFNAFPKYEAYFQKFNEIKHPRLVLTHAQTMAACYATSQLFTGWSEEHNKVLLEYLKDRAISAQKRISEEPDSLAKFWDIYHYLNEVKQGDVSDAINSEKLNHSPNYKEEIAINLPQMISLGRQYGQLIDPEISKLFEKSSTYPFITNKKIRSRIEKRPLNCWIFKKEQNNDVK